MTMDGIEKILEEKEKREDERYLFIKENLDTFKAEFREKMNEVLEAIKKIAEKGEKNQSDIVDIRTAHYHLIEKVGELEQRDKDLKFVRSIGTPLKFIGFISLIVVVVIVLLLAFGFDPLIKVIGVLKNFP